MELDGSGSMGRLSDRICDILKKQILSGRLAPCQHLALEEIAQSLGVSTTPVRDALSQLAADGLIEWRPRRGAFVAHLTAQTVEETFQVREFLECAAIDYAVAKGAAVADQMQPLVEQMAALRTGPAATDPLRYARLVIDFHSLSIKAVDNTRLAEIYASLTAMMAIAFALYPSDERRIAASMAEHQAIVDAIRRGDAEAAREALRAHLRSAGEHLVQRLGGRAARR